MKESIYSPIELNGDLLRNVLFVSVILGLFSFLPVLTDQVNTGIAET